MITLYSVKYHQATDNKSARFTVTRLYDKKTLRLPYNYGATNAEKDAIKTAFWEDVSKLEYVGRPNKTTSYFAINQP
jgi:hypothetical protein